MIKLIIILLAVAITLNITAKALENKVEKQRAEHKKELEEKQKQETKIVE